MISGSESAWVNPGKKNYIEIFIYDFEVKKFNIQQQEEFEFDFKIHVMDKKDCNWEIETDEITLNINA